MKDIALVAIIAIMIIFLIKGCNDVKRLKKDCAAKVLKADTVTITKTDTINISTQVYIPKPYKVSYPVPVYVEGQTIYKADTVKDLADYNAIRAYSDTQTFSEGSIIINDKVTRNAISERQVQASIEQKTITNTITKTIEAKRRNELYLGLGGAVYDRALFPVVSFDMINKRGAGAGIFAGYMREKPMYGVRALFKLSTKKR